MDSLAIASGFKTFTFTGIFVLLFSSCVFAGPTRYKSTPLCVSYCNDANKFSYEAGHKYVYDYSTDIQTLVLEETAQKSHIKLFAQAEIEAITSCDFILQLKNVRVTDLETDSIQKVEDEDFFKKALQLHSIRFSFQDGKIEHLCSNPEEQVWVTNVKRGILSMLQNSMEDLNSGSFVQETDVNGKCATHYNVSSGSSWGGSKTIVKRKDLSGCSQRQNHVTAIQSIPFTSKTGSQGMSILSGHVECNQVIINNKFEKVQCQEEQQFKPFENKNSGAKNVITQTLVYSSTNTETRSPKEFDMIKRSLIFEVDGTTTETKSNIDYLVKLLDSFDKTTTPNIQAEAPALFVELVESLRQVNEETLRLLLEKTTSETKKKYLMDAIPLVNSAPSLAIMRDFFLEGKLSNEIIDSWLRSVTFIKHPSLSMISALSTLLDKYPTPPILLSISSLMNSYCKNNVECSKEKVITEVIEKIILPLKNDCQISSDSFDIREAVVALKALGNVGIYSSSSPESFLLQNCFTKKYNPIEVRVAAIDAYRRIPCSSFSNNKFLNIYADSEENTEVRIKAYMVAMNCADRRTIDTIQTVMHTEVVNQVGSFVWTHLTNLQETNRPDKQLIKALLSNEILKNKFQTDARKFSRNFESSVFSDEYNAGAGVDASLIFTEESFIPKSGMVNLTVQLFGETVNLFEFGGRIHATERLLEPIFGPDGYFPDESMTDFLKNNRRKRDVSNKIERLPSIYEQAAANLDTAPGGSFYARIFGHEFVYKDFEINTDSSIPNVVDENGEKWWNIKAMLDNLSTGKKAEFTKSTILTDFSYSVSTSAGIPLSLGFKAAATVGISAEGKFNVGRFIETKELDIYGLLRPNTAINVDASLTVRLGARNRYVRSGLSVRNVLRSSTAMETQLNIKGLRSIKATFNLPQDRQDIFEASSKVLIVRASGIESVLQPLPGTPKIRDSACLFDKYTDVFGIKLCGEITTPDYFTLTPSTPALAVLYIEKTDKFEGYSIDYNFESNPSTTSLDIVFDTPGSSINRRTAVKFVKETTLGKFQAILEAPNKSIKANGVYSSSQKSLDISVMDDVDRLFHFKSSLHQIGSKIEPKFHLELFKRPLAELKGIIEIPTTNENQKRAVVDLTLQHVTQKPIRINGNFILDGDHQEIILGVESYYLTGNLRSQIKNRRGHLSTKAVLEYSWEHGEINTVDISAKLQRSVTGTLSKFSTAASFIMSKYPDNSVDFLWETLTSSGFCENTAKFSIGKSTWEAHTFFNKQSTLDSDELRIQFALTNLRHEVDYLLEFSHKMLGQSISTKLIGRTDATNEFNAKFEYDSLSRSFLKKNLTAEVTWPGAEYAFQAAIHEKRKGEFEGEIFINLNNYKEMKGTISYINNSSNLKLDHNVEFRARGFTSVPISGSLGFTATDKQSHVGCQIIFEGKKPYNSRLSTSIDYSHIRNTHKIEAKVTFNEKKYNGEVVFGHVKSGTKHIMIDLLLENHIFLEAKMTGRFPQTVVASLMLIPDKDNSPEHKLELNGSVDARNVDFYVNYFGEKVNFDGEYGEGNLRGEASWSNDKRLMLTAKITNSSLSKGSMSIYVITPLEGFQNVSLYWEHEFVPGRWESQLGGNIEEKSMFLQLNGATSPSDLTAKAIVDVTGYQKLEGDIIVVRNTNSKKLQVSFIKGGNEVLLNFDYVNGQDASIVKLEFRGCKYLPEILVEWNQQLSEINISTLKLAWALPSSAISVIHLELEQHFGPNSYKFSVVMPWKTWSVMKGGLTLDRYTSTYKLEMSNTGDVNIIPNKISVGVQGRMKSFDHYATVIWRAKKYDISLQGSAETWYDADVKGGIKLTEHYYSAHLLSKQQNGIHKVEIMTNVDSDKREIGLVVDLGSKTGKQELSAWGNLPSGIEKKASIFFENSNQLRKFQFEAKDDNEVLVEISADVIATGYQFWRLRSELKSSFQSLPSFSIESTHNILDIQNILNAHRMTISPQEGSFLDQPGVLPARNFSIQLSITDLEKVAGSLIWDNSDISIHGEIEPKPYGNNFHFVIKSSEFKDVKVEAGYEFSQRDFKINSILKSNNKKIFEADVSAMKLSGAYSATAYIASTHLPTIDGQIAWDIERGVSEIFLKQNRLSIIQLNANTKATAEEGFLTLTVQSAFFPSLSQIRIETKYLRKDAGSISLEAKYVKDDTNYHLTAVGAFKEDEKFIRLSSDGEFVGSVEVSMESLSKIIAFVTHKKRKLGEIHVSYATSMHDFAWGTHVIQIKYINSQNTPTDVSFSVGIDPKRFYIEILTPFQSWTHIKLYGQVDLQSTTSKIFKLGLHKEQDKLESAFEMKTFKRNGTTSLATEINVVGFTNLRKYLIESVQFVNISERFSDDNKFTTSVRWSSSSFDLKIDMPILDQWKSVKLNANWDLNQVKKFVNLKSEIDGEQMEFRSTAKINKNQGDLEFQLKLQNAYQSKLHYDFSKAYEASLELTGPQIKWNCSGKLWLTNDGVEIQTVTPFKNYEKISGKLSYKKLSPSQQKGSLQWTVNNNAREFNIEIIQKTGELTIHLKTSVNPWEDVKLMLIYTQPISNVQLNIERGDGKKIELHVDLKMTGNMSDISNAALMQLEARLLTPFVGLEKMVLTIIVDRKNSELKAEIAYNKNLQGMKFQLDFLYRSQTPQKVDVNVDMSFGYNQTAKAHAIISIDLNGKSTFATFVESNDIKHEVNAEVDISNNSKSMKLVTTLPFLKTIALSLQKTDEDEHSVHGLWEGNNKVVEVNSKLLWKGLQNGRFNFALISPISGFRNILIESDISVKSGKISFAFIFQNDNARWLAKLDGIYSDVDGTWNIQVNTPINEYQDIQMSLKHTWISSSKEVSCSLVRNAIKLVELEASQKESGLQLAIICDILNYPVALHHHSYKLGQPESNIQMTVSAGQEEFKTNMEISVQGIKSGMINVKTSYLPEITSKFAWKVDGTIQDGNAWASFKNSFFGGTKSVRTLWKKEKDWSQMKAEAWIRSDGETEEKGATLFYSLNSENEENKKLLAQFSYALGNETNSFMAMASITNRQSFYESNIRLETPFEALRNFLAEVSVINVGEIKLKFNSTYNEEHFSTVEATMQLKVAKTNLSLDFNTPMVGTPFQILISYDFEFEKKLLEFDLKQADYLLNIKNYLILPTNQNEVELNSYIYSNVPFANVRVDGNLKGSYQLHSDGISEITVTLESAQVGNWKLLGALRPTSDFHIKGKLDSPTSSSIPSVSTEINWRGNLRQSVSSDFSLTIGEAEYKASLTLASSYLRLTVNSPIRGFTNISVNGLLQSENELKEADLNINIDGEIFRLLSNCNFARNNKVSGSGSVSFLKTSENKQMGSFDLSVEENGIVEIAGSWKRNAFKIRGQMKAENNNSWLKSGATDFSIEIDDIEQMTIHSTHRIEEDEWSLNITDGSSKVFKVHLTKGARSLISSTLQWNTDARIKVLAELKQNSFDIFFSSPWTESTVLHGMFQSSGSQTTAEGYFIYETQKSSVRLETITTNETTKFEISLDIPNFHQKVDTMIAIQASNAYLSGGMIDMTINGRQLVFTGELSTKIDTVQTVGKVKDKKLSLSLKIPSEKIAKISSQILLRRPLHHFGSMKIDGNLQIGQTASNALFEYDLPIHGNKMLGVKASLKTFLYGPHNYELSFQSDGATLRHVTAHLVYNLNEVNVNWRLTMPEVIGSLHLGLANSGFGINEYSINMVGYFNPSELFNISIDAACKEKSLHFQSSVKFEKSGLSSDVSFYSPQLLDSPHHYNLKLNTSVKGNYVLEIFGRHGSNNVDFFGDMRLQNSEFQANGKISGSYGTHFGALNYKRGEDKSHEVFLTLESTSLLLGKKVNVKGKVDEFRNGFEASLQCRTRTSTHTASLSVIAQPENGVITFKTESPLLKAGLFHVEWRKQDSKLTTSISANYQNATNKLEALLDLKDLEGRLTISSPIIPSSKFNLHLKSIFNYDNMEVLADIQIRNFHWRLESVLKFESWMQMMIKLEVLTPYKSFDRLTLGLKSSSDEFYIELHTPIKIIPNAMLKITGLSVVQTGNWKDMHPSITIGLPFGKYSAFCILKTPNATTPGLAHFFFSNVTQEPSETYEFQGEISPLSHFSFNMESIGKIYTRIVTPIPTLRHFEVDAEGIFNGRNLIQISTEGKLNEYASAFALDYQNDNGNPKIRTEVMTPFKSYEKLEFTLSVDSFQKIGNGKSLHMEFENPIWDKIRLDADYRYQFNGLLDMESELNAELFSFMDIPPLHIDLKTGTQGSKFSGVLKGTLRESSGTLKVEAEMTEDEFTTSADVTVDGMDDVYHGLIRIHLLRQGNLFSFQTEIRFQNEALLFTHATFSTVAEVVQGGVKISTPWGPLVASLILKPVSPFLGEKEISLPQLLINTNATFDLRFDDWRIVGFQFVSRKGLAVFEVYNPISPVSLLLNFEHVSKNKLVVTSEICWNLANPVGNTVGFGIVLSKGFAGRHLEFKIQAENAGNLGIIISHSLTSSKLNQSASIAWDSPLFETKGQTGYHILLYKDSSPQQESNHFAIQVDFPERSVMFETFSNGTNKEALHSIILKWDLKRDESKFVHFKLHKEVISGWKIKESLYFVEIVHPLSDQPFMLSLDQIQKDNRFQLIELDIKASENPESNFIFAISRNNTDWKNFNAVIRHAATKLFAQCEVRTTNENTSMGLSYMDLQGEMRSLTLEAFSFMGDQHVELYAGPKQDKIEIFKFERQNPEGQTIMRAKFFTIEADILMQNNLPFLQASVKRAGEYKMKLSGGFSHKKEIGFQISSTEHGTIINYILLLAELTSSNTLSSKVNWFPTLLPHLMEMNIPEFLRSVAVNDIQLPLILNTTVSELEGRLNTISPEIISVLKDIQNLIVSESKMIYEEWSQAVNYISEMYESNTLYMKDICDTFSFALDIAPSVRENIADAVLAVCEFINRVGSQGTNKIREIYENFDGKFESIIMELWNQTEQLVEAIWHDNLATISSLLSKLEIVIKTSLDALEGRIDELEKRLMAVGLIRKAIQIYRDYATWIEEIPIQEYVQNVESIFTIRIWDRISKYINPILEAIKMGTDDQYFMDLLETPPVPYIRYVLKRMSTAFSKFWEVLEVEQKLKQLVRASLKKVDGLLHRYLPTGSLEYDLENGLIDYNQSISALQWQDFTQIPRWRTIEDDAQDVSQLTNFYYQVLDRIENLKPLLNMNIRSVLPPFGSYALMAGDYHYFTFDKKYFRFAGDCSYLLVGDLSHGEDPFSLIVNYENRDGTLRKKSYSITTNGNVVDVDISDFKITVNGKKVELPLNVGSTFIRRHQTGLEMYDKRGFQMTCSLSSSVCTVGVSGWHFGKLAGLLGTYDNEQVNDLKNPQGQIIPDVSAFAYSWRVGKNSGLCRMKNYARDETEVADIDNTCHNLLKNRSSPLRPCFHTVDTEVFMEMCLYDISKNINSANRAEAACAAMSAYVTECQKNNVDVWMPPTCVRCKLEDGTALTTGENATLQVNGERSPPQSSDNVILLEESSCISTATISEAVKRLDLALNAQGIWDNRYSIVGFGGNGLHEKPHIKTNSAQVWAHNTLFKISNESNHSDAPKSDLYEAIQYAATLGFRAGVSKNLIAMTCGNEQCGDSMKYADLLTLLVENDIKLHIVSTKAFTFKGNRKQDETNQIYGMDMSGVYTIKHAKHGTLEADKTLFRQINIPKDLCTPLAMESNGTRFNINQPTKKVLDVWSRRVAQTSHPSECQRCECVPDRYGGANLMCHQCVSPSLWRFMEEWKSYQMQDGGDEIIPFDILDHEDFLIA